MYFLRIQGRVTGPFTLEKLKALRARGVLQRFHELSEDRSNWSEAGANAELFAVSQQSQATIGQVFSEYQVELPSNKGWYYLDSRKEQIGPVDDDSFINLISQGLFTRKTLVWKNGMEGWKAAEEIFPALFQSSQNVIPGSESTYSCSQLAWQLQFRALVLIIWPFYTFFISWFFIKLLTKKIIEEGPAKVLFSAEVKLIVFCEFIYFLIQAVCAIFACVQLVKLGRQGFFLVKVSGCLEFCATSILLVFYSLFVRIIFFGTGILRGIDAETLRATLLIMVAIYSFGQFLSALSGLFSDVGVAVFSETKGQWVWKHFLALAWLSGLMSLNCLFLGVIQGWIGFAAVFPKVFDDFFKDDIFEHELNKNMIGWCIAFLILLGISKWLEWIRCLLIIPMASSLRNTVK